MDGGVWQATVHKVAQGWTRLKRLSMHVVLLDFSSSSEGKESACNTGDPGWTPGREDPLGEGNSTPL